MKIVHITHALLENYGYQDSLLPIAQAQLGHDVTIISTQQAAGFFNYHVDLSTKKTPYQFKGCKVVRLPLKCKVNYRIARYKGLYKCLVGEAPDLIFFHELPYLNYKDIVKYIKQSKCKLFVDYHCDYQNSAKGFFSKVFLHKIFYRFILSRVNRYIDLFYAITPGTATFMKEMYKISGDKIKLLPLGGMIKQTVLASRTQISAIIRKDLGISDTDKLIVMAGKMDSAKNLHNLVKAHDSMQNPHIHLVVIGNIAEDYFKKFEKQVAANKTIHVLGWKSPEEIDQYFLASDLACFPGSQSALWQQAICCELPLLCRYWRGEGAEYLDRGGNVQFLYEGNANEIKNNLEELFIHHVEKLEQMKIVASTKGKDYFSYSNIAQMVINDYTEIMKGK